MSAWAESHSAGRASPTLTAMLPERCRLRSTLMRCWSPAPCAMIDSTSGPCTRVTVSEGE